MKGLRNVPLRPVGLLLCGVALLAGAVGLYLMLHAAGLPAAIRAGIVALLLAEFLAWAVWMASTRASRRYPRPADGGPLQSRLLMSGALASFGVVAAMFALGVYVAVSLLREYGASVGSLNIAAQSIGLVVPLFLFLAIPLTWLGQVLWRRAAR